ncbi:ABC transporter permease [Aureispira anguillae]|uniref:ABC transporter permease n=1 Tax=Aureispira anguillae TaxID=2864201 RepID=A0A915YIE5_9BACT|nr:ABC transporter permease [Aureispira anguillae]BDS13768.1 ABC transporter permease [Aureispira anguillae]
MHTILTVIKKELKDTLRDKKTLFSAIILPALAIPLLLLGVSSLQKNLINKEKEKQLKVVLINAPEAVSAQFQDESITLLASMDLNQAKDSVASEDLDAVLEFAPSFATNIDSFKKGVVNMYYKSTNIMVERRLKEKLDAYEAIVLNQRMEQLNIAKETLTPVQLETINVASAKEQIGKSIGGFIPYIFILFCFMGCMYPALDLITGEKERGTIETLLTVPASRFSILIGKTITIALVGVVASVMTIGGMILALNLGSDIPASFMDSIADMLSLKFILMLFAMLLPLSFFFAGVLSAMVVRTSSFKEAQSYVTPMTFVVIIPALVATMPGVELNWQFALIPILNVALATKEIIAGTIHLGQYITIVFSLIVFATLSVLISYKQFSQEKNVLK